MSSYSRRRPLPFLDSLRGLAALWVVIGHARTQAVSIGVLKSGAILAFLNYFSESLAVPIFIALSGFLLTAPHVEWNVNSWEGPLKFMQRRAKRIYPTYIAVIGITALACSILPSLSTEATARWQDALPIDAEAVITHLVMVHNFFPSFAHKIDPPMWSLAVEWQIYIGFALLMIPISHKFGVKGYFLAGLLTSLLLALSEKQYGILALSFVLGGLGSWVCFGSSALTSVLRDKVPWPMIIALTLAMSLFLASKGDVLLGLSGIGGATFILWLIKDHYVDEKPYGWVATALQWDATKKLGRCSYSLYLLHFPILSLIASLGQSHEQHSSLVAFEILVLGPIISIIFAIIFANVFEYGFFSFSKARVDTRAGKA